ncbi:MAG: allophanate hydrolase subunit 1 [Sulfurimonadaceae bacterium]|nr:allophanate hydrolase subunit 1 [Sulfurimonadaceae bacterium]
MIPSEHVISECCIEYRFGECIDLQTSDDVLRAYRYLKQNLDLSHCGIRDMLPTYSSLAVHFTPESPLLRDTSSLRSAIEDAGRSEDSVQGREFTIDVAYNGEDLAYVSQMCGLSVQEIIDLHSGRPYRVAMLGFRPYFPYLLGLDERLDLPRRESPRTRVRKGSVVIAAGQTGIYSEASPGGWHIIGHTEFDGYDRLRPADTITFRSIPC